MARFTTLSVAVAALLLLAASAADQTLDLPLLEEPGCPPVTPDLLAAFATNADGTTPVNRDQAAALACHLQPVLARAAAGDEAAAATLTPVYLAWRQAFRPQALGVKPSDSKTNWVTNLETIVARNSDPASTFWAGLNAYSGMSADEFAATVLMTGAPTAPATAINSIVGNRKLLARFTKPPVTPTYPSHVDWVAAGRVLPQPGFQSACGSSWAFAAAAALESRLMIDTAANDTAALSPQHMMDCTARMFAYPASTCSFGFLTDAFTFAAERGVTTDAAYRYRSLTPGADSDAPGFQLQCDREFLTGKAAKAGLVRITAAPAYTQVSPANSKLALILALAAQPAVTTLAVDASFQHYAGGIWSSSACAADATPNHALLIVGYSTQVTGQEFFLAKNSMGAGWGQAGFVRLAMAADGAGTCGMYRAAYQPAAVQSVGPIKPGNGNNNKV